MYRIFMIFVSLSAIYNLFLVLDRDSHRINQHLPEGCFASEMDKPPNYIFLINSALALASQLLTVDIPSQVLMTVNLSTGMNLEETNPFTPKGKQQCSVSAVQCSMAWPHCSMAWPVFSTGSEQTAGALSYSPKKPTATCSIVPHSVLNWAFLYYDEFRG